MTPRCAVCGGPDTDGNGCEHCPAVDAVESRPFSFKFTRSQHAQLIAALALAAQQYADPSMIVETLGVISPAAAEGLRSQLAAR